MFSDTVSFQIVHKDIMDLIAMNYVALTARTILVIKQLGNAVGAMMVTMEKPVQWFVLTIALVPAHSTMGFVMPVKMGCMEIIALSHVLLDVLGTV